MKCRYCSAPIRPFDPEEDRGYDRRDFEWVHEDGNPYCDWNPIATPELTPKESQ